MTHPKNLIAWFDNELPVEESDAVGAHVERCSECHEQVLAFAQVTEMVGQMSRGRSWWKRVLIPVPLAAAAMLLMMTHQPPKPRVTPIREMPLMRVAIPAEALLPPGILPPGTEIVADIAADGRATAVSLLP